ncbi:MAG TPA: TetR/AcrR family transcriptional regulator [Longimicrobium sp.]|nr:TetR/AcrR family transcriptional regulator [Longimicrobium sp.]
MEVRERLLNAALRVFEEAGSRGATTRRIAAEAGVNEITLFRHFGSKSVLISEALAAATREPVHTGLPVEPRDPAAELLAWSRAGYAHLRLHAAMIRTTLGELAEAPEAARCVAGPPVRVHTELLEYLQRLRERGMADGEWDADAAANLLMGSLFADAIARDVVPEKYPYPEADAPARYVGMFLRAIGAVPAPAAGPGAADAAPAGGTPEVLPNLS